MRLSGATLGFFRAPSGLRGRFTLKTETREVRSFGLVHDMNEILKRMRKKHNVLGALHQQVFRCPIQCAYPVLEKECLKLVAQKFNSAGGEGCVHFHDNRLRR